MALLTARGKLIKSCDYNVPQTIDSMSEDLRQTNRWQYTRAGDKMLMDLLNIGSMRVLLSDNNRSIQYNITRVRRCGF
jgi:hypothetical protein